MAVPTAPELLLRLIEAALAGAVVGFEREARNRPAGIRTHALVALGAALFTVGGAYGFADITKASSVDPARVAAQVASGIGFIGAGAIIRNGTTVRGVTTAATLWLAAALGLVAGAGMVEVVALGTLVVLATLCGLRAFHSIARRFAPGSGVVEIEYRRGHGTIGPAVRALEDRHADVRAIRIEDDDLDADGPGLRRVSIEVAASRGDVGQAVQELCAREEVLSARWLSRNAA
jgi:putative Mg2+ transporter-C (MgtC) family protein